MSYQPQQTLYLDKPSVIPDDLLIERAYLGDQGAFEALINKYEKSLRGYIKRMLKDEEIIEDILQHVFLQFYLALPKLRTNVPLHAWLYRVTYNRCVDELRRKRHCKSVSFSQLERAYNEEVHLLADMLPDTGLTPEAILEQQELHTQLLQAIKALSPTFRAVVHLRCFVERSFSEIGKQLDMPEGTAKTYFYRSLPRLRAALQTNRMQTEKPSFC
jgi:RNA polymerase sigma factor (sigma-70 family)